MNAMSQGSLPDGGSETSTSTGTLADLRRLAAHITPRAPEIEAERRIPPDLIKALKSAGAFRLFVPRSAGGLELDLPAAVEAIATLARGDGSVGLNVMNASGCS